MCSWWPLVQWQTSKVAIEEASSSSTPRSSLGLTPPEMPSNIGTSLEDGVGTVLFHLVAVARDISARDALEDWDLHEEVDVTSTPILEGVVAKVTASLLVPRYG